MRAVMNGGSGGGEPPLFRDGEWVLDGIGASDAPSGVAAAKGDGD